MARQSHTDENNESMNVCKSSNIGHLFWGLLLILVGVLVIVNNFGIARVNWNNLWRLWPLAIIMTGISMLRLRGWLWNIVMAIVILGSMVLVVWVSIFSQVSLQDALNGLSGIFGH